VAREIVTSPHGDPSDGHAVQEAAPSVRDWAATFLVALARALDEAEIRWLVLRNHEDLPDAVGHDVDVLVHPQDAPRIDGLIRTVVREGGLLLLRTYRGIEHHGFDVATPDLIGRLVLHVDVQTAARYRGRLLIDAEDLLADRRQTAGFWTPSPGMEAYALLLHAALHKGELKEKYVNRLIALEAADPGALQGIAEERLGPTLGRRLAGVRTERDMLATRRQLGRAIDRRFRSNRWRRPWFNVRSGLTMTGLRLRPRGLFVVFLGPDGSGKSTTTDLLTRMLAGRSSVLPVHRVYLGSGTPLLPTRKLMRRIHGKSGRRDDARERLRDVRPRRLRGALHVMTDEILRYWVEVRPRLAPHGIVLADRYAYDLLRVNNPTIRRRWFRRLATAIIPDPHVTFFLEGDPAVIAERKNELTLEETIRQQRAYRELADLVPSFRPLDLTVRDDAALRRVALEILEAYSARNGGLVRHGNGRSAKRS
jgi:thymidylate kinase